MKIRMKLQLIIIVSILILAGIVSVSLLWQKQAETQLKQQALVGELNRAIFEQAQLREEYFLYREERSKEQFMLINKQIEGFLERMSGTFIGLEEKASLIKMMGFHNKIEGFFNQLVRVDQSATVHTATSQALRERIISQMLVNAHSLYQEGLRLLNVANEKTVYQNNLAHLYSNIGFGLLALFVVTLAVIITRSVTYPLTRLHKGTEIIAEGNLDYKTNIRTHDEIGQLSTAFDVMTENLTKITVSRDELSKEIKMRKQAEEALRASEEKYRSIFENAIEGIFQGTPEGRIITSNPAHARIYGYDSPEDMINSVTDVGRQLYVDQEQRNEFARLVIEKGIVENMECEKYRKDGTRIWTTINMRAIRDGSGNVQCFEGTVEDITVRKLAEEKIKSLLAEKELLLREVHHRIKNNMNVIVSLLSLQSDTLKDPSAIAALEDARNRVRSMMILYDKLYRSGDFRAVSAKAYLTSLIDEIVVNFPNRGLVTIETQIDDVILDATTLSPIGIILNELLTNAMKHAFPSLGAEGRGQRSEVSGDEEKEKERKGEITITLKENSYDSTLHACPRIAGAIRSTLLALIVSDNGVGVPESIDIGASTGFGMQLVSMLAEQLEGTIRIERQNGTRFILDFEV